MSYNITPDNPPTFKFYNDTKTASDRARAEIAADEAEQFAQQAATAVRGFYGPWDTIEEAIEEVPLAVRYRGLTVGIVTEGVVDDYWWKSGLTDVDLEIKQTGGSSPEGPGYDFILF